MDVRLSTFFALITTLVLTLLFTGREAAITVNFVKTEMYIYISLFRQRDSTIGYQLYVANFFFSCYVRNMALEYNKSKLIYAKIVLKLSVWGRLQGWIIGLYSVFCVHTDTSVVPHSCAGGRCNESFSADKHCYCNPFCVKYNDCCFDFHEECDERKIYLHYPRLV